MQIEELLSRDVRIGWFATRYTEAANSALRKWRLHFDDAPRTEARKGTRDTPDRDCAPFEQRDRALGEASSFHCVSIDVPPPRPPI
jgi:hypothetical protein